LRGHQARRVEQLVAVVEDDGFVEEGLQQVERHRGDGVVEAAFAHAGRELGVAAVADDLAHAQAGAAVALVQVEHLPREDQVRVADLLQVHAPQLGPAPGRFQEQARHAPEGVATLDGVAVGRVGRQLGQGHAGFGDLLGGGALLRGDGEVGLGPGRHRQQGTRQHPAHRGRHGGSTPEGTPGLAQRVGKRSLGHQHGLQ